VVSPTPDAGEHNDEILAELGYDAAAIAQMRAEGAI
jgi:crotonobetainyl-CoA:carnitine CoA-transferase CaiB-like acyl-CoA transferase